MTIYRRYDHRVRNAIAKSGNPNLFPELCIPLSTARTWIAKGEVAVISTQSLNLSTLDLITKVANLETEHRQKRASSELLQKTFHVFGFQIQYKRLPFKETKQALITAIQVALHSLTLEACLATIGLSKSRYSARINRLKKCSLDDRSSCPKLNPSKLMNSEVELIKTLITDKDFGHFSISGLVLFAKRHKLVHASAASWYHIARTFGLRRPGKRPWPAKPDVGIKAKAPNCICGSYIDMTKIRLKNGAKVCLQAVVDYFSRFVLAFHVSEGTTTGLQTKNLLSRALKTANRHCFPSNPILLADAGTENTNFEVKQLIKQEPIKLLIAQLDIRFSISLAWRFFYRLKRQHLYQQCLASIEDVIAEATFFIEQHNKVMPMEILVGGTPFEVFRGTWTEAKQERLASFAIEARNQRTKFHQNLNCLPCPR